MPGMQAGPGRVETGVDGDRPALGLGRQRVQIGGLGDQAAPAKLVKNPARVSAHGINLCGWARISRSRPPPALWESACNSKLPVGRPATAATAGPRPG